MYVQLHGLRQQSSVNKSTRKKVVTSFLMFWYEGLKYTPYYNYKIFRTWSCHQKKSSVLNNASFMLIVCYIYAICFKQLFLYLYLRLCNQKISTKLFLVLFQAWNIPATPRNKANKFLVHCNWNVKKTNCQSENFALPYYCLFRSIIFRANVI